MRAYSKRMLVLLTFISVSILSLSSNAQQESDEAIVKKIADKIISETTFGFKNKKTGEVIYDLKKAGKELYLTNPYNEWKYWNGVLGIAMQSLSSYTKDAHFADYAKKNIFFSFDNRDVMKQMTTAGHLKGMDQFFKHELLDDCGAMGASLIEVYNTNKRADFREYIDKTAKYILSEEHRLADGTLARTWPHNKTVWLDDLYMSVPFMARYAVLSKDDKYFDFSINQVNLFTKHLYSPKSELFFHCYYDGINQNGPAFWGRANGWGILAQVELLSLLPKDHQKRDSLIELYRRQVVGFSKYQSSTGLWHQLLNKPDSYLETSSTAMFTYAVAAGINNGWLDKIYADLALSGWAGVKSMITPDGKVKNISKGTGTNTSLKYYYDRPTPLNDIHGLGPVLMAGIEVLKLQQKLKQ